MNVINVNACWVRYSLIPISIKILIYRVKIQLSNYHGSIDNAWWQKDGRTEKSQWQGPVFTVWVRNPKNTIQILFCGWYHDVCHNPQQFAHWIQNNITASSRSTKMKIVNPQRYNNVFTERSWKLNSSRVLHVIITATR